MYLYPGEPVCRHVVDNTCLRNGKAVKMIGEYIKIIWHNQEHQWVQKDELTKVGGFWEYEPKKEKEVQGMQG